MKQVTSGWMWSNKHKILEIILKNFKEPFNHDPYINNNINTTIKLKKTPKNCTIIQTKTSGSNNITYIRILPRYYQHLYTTLFILRHNFL